MNTQTREWYRAHGGSRGSSQGSWSGRVPRSSRRDAQGWARLLGLGAGFVALAVVINWVLLQLMRL